MVEVVALGLHAPVREAAAANTVLPTTDDDSLILPAMAEGQTAEATPELEQCRLSGLVSAPLTALCVYASGFPGFAGVSVGRGCWVRVGRKRLYGEEAGFPVAAHPDRRPPRWGLFF